MKYSLFIFFLSLLIAHSTSAQQNNKQAHPNILIIFSDDHAYQAISAYGSKFVQTPNIDRIAKEGAVFKNVFVTNSLCAPSRATLLTGKYSHVNGLKVNNINNPFNIRQQLFTRILQQNNYQTAWIGKWHLQTLPGDAFNYWMVPPDQGNYYNPDFINMQNDTVRIDGYITEIISDLAFDWLSNKRDKDKPFCLVVGEKATHREWLPDIQDLGAYDDRTFKLPANFYDKYEGRDAAAHQDMTIDKTMRLKEDLKVHLDYNNGPYDRFNSEQKKAFIDYYDDKITSDFDAHHYTGDSLLQWKYQRYLKDYLSVAKSLDRNIGKILDYLDQNGLAENTVVIYASDQGFYMGEHGWFDKRFMYEESFRTPFVMRYPEVIKPGTSVNNMVANIDFAPTLLDIAGVNAPPDIQGNSFLPVLENNQNTSWRDGIYYHYYEYPEPHKVSPHFGIRTKQYKLIRFYGPADFWELYDLKKDPGEMQNIYNKKEYATIIAGLKKKLDLLIEKYSDKEAAEILKGK